MNNTDQFGERSDEPQSGGLIDGDFIYKYVLIPLMLIMLILLVIKIWAG